MQRLCQSCSKFASLAVKQKPFRLESVSVPRPLLVNLLSTESLPPPVTEDGANTYPEKIQRIVKEISQLTLLETSQLNELLKTTLNIPDAPMMAVGSMPMQSSPEAEVTSEDKKEEQPTSVTVKLVKYADDSKIKLIKEIKAITEGMNLVQAKKFVESVPQVVKKDVSKEDAEKLKAALEAAGGIVEFD